MDKQIYWFEGDELREIYVIFKSTGFCVPINVAGYNEINELIDVLKQARDNIIDICFPVNHQEDMNESIGQSEDMGNVRSGDKRVIYPPRIVAPKIKSRKQRKISVRSGY